ncbi:hypothetical protein [Pantoea agglomerans]
MKGDDFDDEVSGELLSLTSSFIVGDMCFRIMSRGEAPLRATLLSALEKALAGERDATGAGALSLQLAIRQLEIRPVGGP